MRPAYNAPQKLLARQYSRSGPVSPCLFLAALLCIAFLSPAFAQNTQGPDLDHPEKSPYNQGPDLSYLKHLPAPPQVLGDMKGGDQLDTLHRQSAAFSLLADVIRKQMSGRKDTTRTYMREEKALRAYNLANTALIEKRNRYFGGNCSSPECVASQKAIQGYADSAEFRADVYGRYGVTLAASPSARPAAPGTAPAAASDSYLDDVPEPQKIIDGIQGSDPVDTRIRRHAALNMIGETIKDLARMHPTPRGKMVLQKYTQAANQFLVPGNPQDFFKREWTYQASPEFKDQVFGFFPPSFRARFEQQKATQQAERAELGERIKAAEKARREEESSRRLWSHAGEIGWVILIAIIAAPIGWYYSRKQKLQRKVEANRQEFCQLKEFGNTPEEREEGIYQFFDLAMMPIAFKDMYYRGMSISFEIEFQQNLGQLQPKHREALRLAYLLFNRGLMNEKIFFNINSVILWNGGNAVVISSHLVADRQVYPDVYRAMTDIHSFRGLPTAEAATAHIRSETDRLHKERPADPTIQIVYDRVTAGGAWLGSKDLPGSVFQADGARSLFLGRLDGSNEDVAYAGEGTLVTIAPPGKGKSQCHAIPALLQWPGSAIVLDIKGELFEATSKHRASIGRVIRFSPFETMTARYNPLTILPTDPNEAWTEAEALATLITPNTSTNEEAKFWADTGHLLLSAVLGYVALTNKPDQRSFSEVLDILSGADWDRFMGEFENITTTLGVANARRIAAHFRQQGIDNPKQLIGSLSSAFVPLSATWGNPQIAAATDTADWTPDHLHTKAPLTVFISAEFQQLKYDHKSLFRTILGQHLRMLLKQKYLNSKDLILILVDEFPAMGEMPPIEMAVTLGRQYGLRPWLMAQTVNQIVKDCKGEVILKAADVRVYMNPDPGTAKHLSEELGDREEALDGQKHALVTPQELTGPAYAEMILAKAQGMKPARLRKVYSYSDPAFAPHRGTIAPGKAALPIT